MWTRAISFLSPAGELGKLSTFIFHRVLNEPDPLLPGEPDAARFETIITWINQWFNVLPLSVAIEKLRQGTLPERAACITFDDGYADNFTVALPILKKYATPATVFIATGYLDGGRMWNDTIIETIRGCASPSIDLSGVDLGEHDLRDNEKKRSAISTLLGRIKHQSFEKRLQIANAIGQLAEDELPDNLMMTSNQLVALRRSGLEIGAHTINHPILTGLDLPSARHEIIEGKRQIEQLLGEEISVFAYPNGQPGADYLPEHVHLVRDAGFIGAVSTSWGVGQRNSDLYQLPRFTPWDRIRNRFAFRLIQNLRTRPATPDFLAPVKSGHKN